MEQAGAFVSSTPAEPTPAHDAFHPRSSVCSFECLSMLAECSGAGLFRSPQKLKVFCLPSMQEGEAPASISTLTPRGKA